MTMTGGQLTHKPYYSSHVSKDGIKCGDCGGRQETHGPPLAWQEVSGSPPTHTHLQKVRGLLTTVCGEWLSTLRK